MLTCQRTQELTSFRAKGPGILAPAPGISQFSTKPKIGKPSNRIRPTATNSTLRVYTTQGPLIRYCAWAPKRHVWQSEAKGEAELSEQWSSSWEAACRDVYKRGGAARTASPAVCQAGGSQAALLQEASSQGAGAAGPKRQERGPFK